jgi:hypothetical protein
VLYAYQRPTSRAGGRRAEQARLPICCDFDLDPFRLTSILPSVHFDLDVVYFDFVLHLDIKLEGIRHDGGWNPAAARSLIEATARTHGSRELG